MNIRAVAMMVCFLAAIISVAEANDRTIMVEEGNTTFNVTRHDNGLAKPYKIEFEEKGILSRFVLDREGLVRVVVVGSEEYKVIYDSDGDLVKVKIICSGRRYLAKKGNDHVDQIIQRAALGRRRLYDCMDCYGTWDVVCGKGYKSVCDLEHLDANRLSETAVAAISQLCNSLQILCDTLDGATACGYQCECIPALQISLEWSDVADLDLVVIEPGGAIVSQAGPSGNYGFLDNDNVEGPGGDPENYLVASGLSGSGMLGDYNAYVRAFSLSNGVSWHLTASVDGHITLQAGGTLAAIGDVMGPITVDLREYKDNECTNFVFHVVENVGKGR